MFLMVTVLGCCLLQNHERSASCNPRITSYMAKSDSNTDSTRLVGTSHTVNTTRRNTPSKQPMRSAVKTTSVKKTPSKSQNGNQAFEIRSPKSPSTGPSTTAIPTRVTPPRIAKQHVNNNMSSPITNKRQCHTVAGRSNKSMVTSRTQVYSTISRKRKEFTPVKSLKERTASPLRKVPKKSFDIYVDPELAKPDEFKTPMNGSKGLATKDMNSEERNDSTANIKSHGFKVPVSVSHSVRSSILNKVNSTSAYKQTPAMYTPLAGMSGASTGPFKTPNSAQPLGSFKSTNNSSSFAPSTGSSMKVTPPLCQCGRRSKRRMVQSPGQNMGRFFFSCTVKKSIASKDGCKFFKWETSGLEISDVNKSWHISKQFTPVVHNSYLQASSYNSQKRNLGVRSNSTIKKHFR